MPTKEEALSALDTTLDYVAENDPPEDRQVWCALITIREYIENQVPEGYALVPIEPTGPMLMYGIHAHERNDDLPNLGLGPKCVGIYKAMIKAGMVK